MNHSQQQNRKKAKKGFSIIEVILAGSILALIVFGIVSAWLYGQHALVKSGDTGRGVAIASEGIEIMRNLRDFDFGILQDGTYALSNNGSGWVLVPNDKETIGVYKRYLTIVSDGISKRNITSTVEWTNVDGSPGIISSNTVLTNWQQQIRRPVKSTTLQISEVVASPAETSVTITWKTNKLASSRVQYGTTASYGSLTPVTDLSPMVLNHSVTITGLSMATTYHFRVTSVDATGAQAYSNDATFTTSADVTAPVISNIVATPGLNSVVITWDTNEASSSYVNYGPTTSYGTTTTEIDTSPRVVNHTVTITGLTANTLYHFRVNSVDASANAATSADGTFTTTAPTVVISNVETTVVSTTYFTVTWTTNIVANSTVSSDNNDFADVTIDNSPMVTSHSVTVSGLTPCTEYRDVRVTSENNGGTDFEYLPAYPTTRGCPAQILSTTDLQIKDINTIAIRPLVAGDASNYVYALNASGANSPELSIIQITHGGGLENERRWDSAELAAYNIPVSKQVFALRDYLYVLGDRHKPVAIFKIADTPEFPVFSANYSEAIDVDPLSLYIRDMDISGQTATVMFLGYEDKIRIIRMTPALDPGSPASPISPLEDPSVWTEIGVLTFDLPKVYPYDIWVSDRDHGQYYVYVKSDVNIFMELISPASPSGEMTTAAHSNANLPNWIVGRNDLDDVFSTGDNFLNRTPLAFVDPHALDHTDQAKAISKTFPISPYLFVNTDQSSKEYRAISVDADGTSELYENIDLSGTFDGSFYGTSIGSTIGYMEDDRLLFYSKMNRLLIIDPGI
ncbi:MAG TPA: fibronectin type III domain-containing protein [Candidatus Paceibacterota bacterium]|nr:fibronectin type III domain-containing protein [Candidatus Paceibacterota bacterium]